MTEKKKSKNEYKKNIMVRIKDKNVGDLVETAAEDLDLSVAELNKQALYAFLQNKFGDEFRKVINKSRQEKAYPLEEEEDE